jgi:hypothetical protein
MGSYPGIRIRRVDNHPGMARSFKLRLAPAAVRVRVRLGSKACGYLTQASARASTFTLPSPL